MTTTSIETVTINGTVLQLDALVQGYAEVLEQAKSQLERFEISELDWARLAVRVQQQLDISRLARTLASEILLSQNTTDPETEVYPGRYQLNMLTEALIKAARDRLDDQIQMIVKAEIRRALDETRTEIIVEARSAAEHHVRHLDRNEAAEVKRRDDCLRELLQSFFQNQLKSNALEAARQLNEELEQNKRDREAGLV